MSLSVDIRCVVDAQNSLGEGVLWDPVNARVWWVDVPMPSRLFCYTPSTGTVVEWPMPEMITSLAVRSNRKGLLVASHGGINVFDPSIGKLERILCVEPNKPFNRCNDGAVDSEGNFWFGTMQNNIAPNGDPIELVGAEGSIYRLSSNSTVKQFDTGFTVTNTCCWSPENTVFYTCDSLNQRIYAYDYSPIDACIKNKRLFTDYAIGVPDGSAVDEEGYLWNARWGGGCVARFAPDGSLDRIIKVPCENPTSCAFGGKNLEKLYVTTARYGLSEESLQKHPQSGGLFSIEPGVSGLPCYSFSG